MGSLILCHDVKAKEPYHIVRLDLPIYTIEELCYYLYHNLYLIDRSVMSEQLCSWLERELRLNKLASRLRREVEFGLSVQGFILPIFEEIGYCSDKEMQEIKAQLQIFKRQTETERRKYRADNLIRNGHFRGAIQEYQYILLDKRDEKLKKEFICNIYHNMGTAYARMFQFEKAAQMFLTAYEYDQKEEILKNYLRACASYMGEREYEELLAEEKLYIKLAAQIQQEEKAFKEKEAKGETVETQMSPEMLLERWRRDYEKNSV